MKFMLKVLLLPLRLALWLLIRVLALATYLSSFALGIISALIGIMAVVVLITASLKNGVILLGVAFLISPVGIPMLSVKLLSGLTYCSAWMRELTA